MQELQGYAVVVVLAAAALSLLVQDTQPRNDQGGLMAHRTEPCSSSHEVVSDIGCSRDRRQWTRRGINSALAEQTVSPLQQGHTIQACHRRPQQGQL